MKREWRIQKVIGRAILVAALLFGAGVANAQIVVGDNLHMTMNGTAGFGYSGAYGNYARSGHGTGFGFNGLLNGYYFSPKFVNFDFRPYFNRMQSNSESQSITRGTGLGGSVGFFSNTFFPGSITYGKDFSDNSEYLVGGIPSVLSNSSSQSLGISWALLLPNKPTLTANYSIGSSHSNIETTGMESRSGNRTFTLGSTYKWNGWDMVGTYAHYSNNFHTPEFLTGVSEDRTGSGSNYAFTTQHKIPIDGSVSFGVSRQAATSSENDHSSGTSYSASAGITPFGRLGLSGSVSYSTNGSESALYSLLGNNVGTVTLLDRHSSILFLASSASVYIVQGLSLVGHITQRQQDYGYGTLTDTQYGGTLSFRTSHRFLGSYYFSGGVVDSATKMGNTGAGLTATVGMDRYFGKWNASADFNYMQNVQTLYSVVNTSNFNYGGSIRRKVNPEMYVSLFVRSSRSGLVTQEGTGNKANSFGGSLSWKGYGLSSNYSASDGAAILGGNGTLVPTPEGPILTPDFVYFDAKSFSVSASKRLFHRLLLSSSYSRVESNTDQKNGNTMNRGNRFSFNTQYTLRKVSFTGGFTRSEQEFSSLVGGPRMINSYFFSINRWFNIF